MCLDLFPKTDGLNKQDRLTLIGLMTIHQFIFSNQRKHRLARHLVFWGVYCLFNFCTASNADSLDDLRNWKFYFFLLKLLVFFLPAPVFIVYMVVYVLGPRLIMRGKYFTFVLAGIAVVLLCLVFNMIFAYAFNFLYPDPPLKPASMHFIWLVIDYNQMLHRGIPMAIGVTCLVLARGLYLQQIENNRLAKLETENRTKFLSTDTT